MEEKRDPQILELEGLRGLRDLGNKKRSDFYPKIRYFCYKNFFLSPRMADTTLQSMMNAKLSLHGF